LLHAVFQSEYNGILYQFTKRSIIVGGPLVKNNDIKVLELLLKTYGKYANKHAIYTQIRNIHSTIEFRNVFELNEFHFQEHLNIIIDLSKTNEELWKDVFSKRRNEIRKAEKEGVEVREIDSFEELQIAYSILVEVYSRAKFPLANQELFNNSFRILFPKGLIKYFGAFYNNNLIGILITLCYKNVIYDWYAGSFKRFYNKCPNDLLPWKVFLNTKAQGYNIFDFGGAGHPDSNYGVRDYKKKFGGTFVNYGRYQIIHKKTLFFVGKVAFTLWQKLK
jgi:serine/alanine adding enzyme